jgi:hypothetical protein
MTIKQQGGIFGRNPTFNDVDINGTLTGSSGVFDTLSVDTDVLVVDSTNDRIGVGTASPETDISVVGRIAGNNGTATITLENPKTASSSGLSMGKIQWKTKDASAPGVAGFIDVQDYNNFGTAFKMLLGGGLVGSSVTGLELDALGNATLPVGNLIIGTSGQGIDFSATSDPSSPTTTASELFDDYEEGTWTGTYGGSTAGGTYTKIGRLVYAAITLTANSESFSSITGLPYTSATAGYEGGYWGRVLRADVLDANGVPCRVTVSGTTITFNTNAAGGADGAFTVTTDASGAVRVGLSVVYYV